MVVKTSQENVDQQEEREQSKALAQSAERWVLLATILISSMAFFDGTALNVALPALQADLAASGAQLLWIANAYLLMLAALIMIGGSLGDRYGRKKVFMIGTGIFMVASLACGLAPDVDWLIAARVAQGAGGALMIPGSLAILSATFDPARRGQAIGTWSAATTVALVAGPVLGGLLADLGWWRGVFLINIPIGILALAILWWKVPESRDETARGRLDVAGAILVSAGLAGLSYGLIAAPELGLGDPLVTGTLGIGILALVGFVWVEARSHAPMMPLHLFNSRTFSGANLLTLFLYGGLNVTLFFLSLNLVQAQGYSKSQAGLATLPFSILLILLSRWTGSLADRYGPRALLVAGPALVGLGFIWMGLAGLSRGPAEYWTAFFPGILLFGVGMGLTVAPLTTAVMSSVATHYAGTASGVNNAVSRIASVLAIAVAGAVALLMYAGALQRQVAPLDLSAQARAALQVEARNLGGAAVPEEVDVEAVPAVERALRLAFVDAYRAVMLLSAGLAGLSALMAALLVEPKRPAERYDSLG